MSIYATRPLVLDQIRTYPLASRKSKVTVRDFALSAGQRVGAYLVENKRSSGVDAHGIARCTLMAEGWVSQASLRNCWIPPGPYRSLAHLAAWGAGVSSGCKS